MTPSQAGIIALVKSALTGKPQAVAEGFSFAEAYADIRRSDISAVCFAGARICGVDAGEMSDGLFMSYCNRMQVAEDQDAAVKQIFDAFGKANVDYMPLKGCMLRPLYPKPEYRQMGDADILVREEQADKAATVLSSLGFTHKLTGDGQKFYRREDLNVEIHTRLFGGTNKFSAYYSDVWQKAEAKEGCRYCLSDEDTFVYIFAHFTSHYMFSGVGIRQATDLWVYKNSHPEIDEDRILKEMRLLGIDRFYANVMHTLKVWYEDGQPDVMSDFVTLTLCESGVFGPEMGHWEKEIAKKADRTGSGKKAIRGYVLSRIFPGLKSMRTQYPVLKKHPVLLPVCWTARVFRILFRDRKKTRRKLEHFASVTDSDLKKAAQALKYVGLE